MIGFKGPGCGPRGDLGYPDRYYTNYPSLLAKWQSAKCVAELNSKDLHPFQTYFSVWFGSLDVVHSDSTFAIKPCQYFFILCICACLFTRHRDTRTATFSSRAYCLTN